jgi:hypothetical protein
VPNPLTPAIVKFSRARGAELAGAEIATIGEGSECVVIDTPHFRRAAGRVAHGVRYQRDAVEEIEGERRMQAVLPSTLLPTSPAEADSVTA